MPEVPKGLGTIEGLIRRFHEAQSNWEQWRSLHQEAFDFSAPQRETFHKRNPGQRKNRHIFDSTAVTGLEQFANRIQGSLLPSWQQWMMLEAGSDIPDEDKDRVNQLLEETTDTFFSELNRSNFSTEITPSLSDLGIGTGAIMIEEGEFGSDEIFRFTNVPLAECYPENPFSGPIKTVWRKHELAVERIKQIWPEAELPPSLADKVKNEPRTKVELLNGMVYNHEDKKYHHIIIFEKDKAVLFTQAFNTQRLIVFRWHLTPGEIFGRGPIMQVLPDIRTVNKVKQFILENAALQMAGVYTGLDDGIFNPHTVRIAPGSVIPVNSNNQANPSLRALDRAGDIGIGQLIIEDLQNTIKKALFADPLGELTDPVKSATEIMVRKQEMLTQAGASLGRLKTELIEPIVAAGIDILGELGKIEKIRVDGKEVAIKQASPLAKSEDLEDFQNFQVWTAALAQTAQLLGPEAGAALLAATIKIEEVPDYMREKLGVPAKLARSEDERDQVGTQIAGALQQGIGGGQVG